MHANRSDASPDAARRRQRVGLWLAIASGPLAAVLLLVCYLWVADRTLLGEIVTIWPPVGWGFLLFVRAAVLRIRRQNRVALATLVGTVAFLVGTTEWKPTTLPSPSSPGTSTPRAAWHLSRRCALSFTTSGPWSAMDREER